MILPILLIPLHKPINILVNTHWIELLKNAFIFTDIMYSYIKFINSILGNTVITESSERLKEALRPFHIYNNSNISLPTLSLTQNEKINNQKKSDSFIQGHLFLVLTRGEFIRIYILPPQRVTIQNYSYSFGIWSLRQKRVEFG